MALTVLLHYSVSYCSDFAAHMHAASLAKFPACAILTLTLSARAKTAAKFMLTVLPPAAGLQCGLFPEDAATV